MADKLQKMLDTSRSSEVSECTDKEVRQEAKSFQFLWPRCCMQSGCPSPPLHLQCSDDLDFKNCGGISSKPRRSMSADAITPGTDTSMYKDVKESVFPSQDIAFSRKRKVRTDLNSVNTNLLPFVENKEPRSALDLDNPTEIFPSHLKKRKQFSDLDTNGSLQKSKFQGENMESGTWAYDRRETSENGRLLHEMNHLGGQLHQLIVMQNHMNGFKAGNHPEKGRANFDVSVKNYIGGFANLVRPKYLGKQTKETISCIDMKSNCSFLAGVIEEQAAISAPCHSMCGHDIQGRFRQRCKEATTSNRRELDNFFDNRYVRTSNGLHMDQVYVGGSLSLPSNAEFLINSSATKISKPAMSFPNEYKSKIEERSLYDSQRVPKFRCIGSSDQTGLMPFKCSMAAKYFISESNNRINSLEEICEQNEKTLTSDCYKTCCSRTVGNASAASVLPNEGPSDYITQRGLSSWEPDKNVFGESNKENGLSSRSPKEKGSQVDTETESLDAEKEEVPSFGLDFLEGREVDVSKTDGLHGEDTLCRTKPTLFDSEKMVQTIETPEPKSRWVKRLQLCSIDSFALGTNSFNMDYSPGRGQAQKLFTRVLNYSRSNSNKHLAKDAKQKTGESMAVLVNYRDSPVELLKKSYPWIQRWCRTGQQHGHPRLASEDQLSSRRETQVPCQGGFDEVKQFPSIGALALMGKAATNFRPCEFRRRGPSIVWNTNGMLQE